MPNRRNLVLCADDFGLSRTIDDGILSLIEAGRLSATSCMVAGVALSDDAIRLAAYSDRVDIGLHFTLTDLPSLGAMPAFSADGRAPSLGSVLGRAFTGRLVYAEIKAEIGRQVARFREIFGRGPDFFDGHQHVHLMPTVRAAMFASFEDGTLDARATWIRDCSEDASAIVRRGVEVPKTLFISALASGLRSAARVRGIETNEGFGGVTAFDRPFRPLMQKFLSGAGPRPMVMCHPAAAPDGLAGDPIGATRAREYAYLASDDFASDLAAAGVSIRRFRDTARETPVQRKARA